MTQRDTEDRDSHLRRVRQREAEVLSAVGRARIDMRAKEVLRPANDDRTRLVNEAIAAPSRAKAIVWLHRAADRLGQAVAPEVACRRGCDACCHQDVLVSHAEAELIGRAIGRRPVTSPAGGVAVGHDVKNPAEVPIRYSGRPCTFLKGSECSIFRHRPLMCRLHANFDHDALLCQIVSGETIFVPYVDTTIEKAVYHRKVATGGLVADLRDWFPVGVLE